MRLGIDFGTTRIVVAAADRGNYPVLLFETADGETRDWFPPLVAARGEERRYGWEAWSLQGDPEWTIVRSVKRILHDAGPLTIIELGETAVPLRQLLTEMTAALRRQILEASNLPERDDEKLEVELGTPANANTNQRFLTAEAFRWGGFEVLGLLNEPSAACIEFTHQHPAADAGRERYVLVYDLGGGTFDASLVRVTGVSHEVVGTEGIATLGGDDFDDVLAEMALESIGLNEAQRDELSQTEWFRLREECRLRKEALHPNTRRVALDLEWAREGWGEARVEAADYYERCAPVAAETLHAIEDLLARAGFASDGSGEDQRLEVVYVAGGGSELPMIPRALRDKFGRRVRRSAHGRASTAIGLAIQADATQGYVLRDRFTRHFGVWRETDHGRQVSFDPLFSKDAQLPAAGEESVRIARAYPPAHNVGHFRYLECGGLTPTGGPAGDITLWDEIVFPFDPELRDREDLATVEVRRVPEAENSRIEEVYSCDAGGRITVQIANRTAGYERDYPLGRWAASARRLRPGRRGTPRKSKEASRKTTR